jgi:hypothetical protein
MWHFIKFNIHNLNKSSHSGIIYNTSISTLKNEIILFLKPDGNDTVNSRRAGTFLTKQTGYATQNPGKGRHRRNVSPLSGLLLFKIMTS